MDARSWEMPNPPVLAAPDRFLLARLRLDDAWLSPDGEWRPIRSEPTPALWSILGYLRWHAPDLQAQHAERDAFADPYAFLESCALVGAIDSELARRGATVAGEALSMVRAIGPAPWELQPDPRVGRRRSADVTRTR